MAERRRRRRLSRADYVEGVLGADRAVLGRAITLVESNLGRHQDLAQEVLQDLLPHTGQAHRVGITGVPGVGKSTFIEGLGMRLVEQGHRLAVLAIDPTSGRTGGSILGDKTRMARLSVDPRCFIRPSPTEGSLGGVHRKTRETLLLCEAAGHDVVFVETVGVGQSEFAVAQMVDSFLVLMLAGAGDGLQGIKRGILELAEVLVVHKADGDNVDKARRAAREYAGALHYMQPTSPGWTTPVLTASSLTGEGVAEAWEAVQRHHAHLTETGGLESRRQQQRKRWLWDMVDGELGRRFREHEAVRAAAPGLEDAVLSGQKTAVAAARELLQAALGAGFGR
jgi:LAO/AO transport system kinase